MAVGLEAVAVTNGVFTDNQVLDGQIVGLSISNTLRKEYTFFAYNLFDKSVMWGAQLQVRFIQPLGLVKLLSMLIFRT